MPGLSTCQDEHQCPELGGMHSYSKQGLVNKGASLRRGCLVSFGAVNSGPVPVFQKEMLQGNGP
jgi:hypothetical protein